MYKQEDSSDIQLHLAGLFFSLLQLLSEFLTECHHTDAEITTGAVIF